MTTSDAGDDPAAASSGSAKRAALRGARLLLWGVAMVAVAEALLEPAMVVARTVGDLADVDRWFATAVPVLRGLHVVGLGLVAAGTATLLQVSRARLMGGVALVLVGVGIVSMTLRLTGLLVPAPDLVWAATGGTAVGLVAALTVAVLTARQLGRRAPLFPVWWAAALLTVALVTAGYRTFVGIESIARFKLVATVVWVTATTGMVVAGVAALRARRAVVRAVGAVPRSADEPPDAHGGDWLAAKGWAYYSDGVRLIAVGLLVRVAATGLTLVVLGVVRAADVELLTLMLRLSGPVVGFVSAVVMLAGAHALSTGPRLPGVRWLAWGAAGCLLGTMVLHAAAYETLIALAGRPLQSFELEDHLQLLDIVSVLLVYVALAALLHAARVATGALRLDGLRRRARSFGRLWWLAVALALAYLGIVRLRAGFELLLMFGSIAVFVGLWLLIGGWRLFKDVADEVEHTLSRDAR